MHTNSGGEKTLPCQEKIACEEDEMNASVAKKNKVQIAVLANPSFFLFLPGGISDLSGTTQKYRNAKTIYIGPQGFDALYPWAQMGPKMRRNKPAQRISQPPLQWYGSSLPSSPSDTNRKRRN